MSKTKVQLGLKGVMLLPLLGVTVAATLSVLAPSLARADDITVIASVIDSTPSASPTQFVTLPIGGIASAAPTVDIQLTGLDPYSFVQIFAQSEPVLIASGFADKYGVFKAKAPLPSNLEVGDHTITASIQKAGETVAVLQTLAKFVVSAGGKVQNAATTGTSSNGTGSSGGNSTGQGASDGGGTISVSPMPTPLPSASSNSVGGVLLVGGAIAESRPTWNINGESARIAISLQNNYKKSYPIKASIDVTNILGWQVASISDYPITELASGKHLMLIAKTKVGIGQWGFYSASIRVTPPRTLDGITLTPLVREISFFVIPIWPTTAVALVIIWQILRRAFGPRIRTMRLARLQASLIDVASEGEQ